MASRTHVRAEPAKGTRSALIGHLLVELVREGEGEGHQLLGLTAGVSGTCAQVSTRHAFCAISATVEHLLGGVSEHDTLVTGTVVLEVTVVEALGDIGGLLLDSDEDVAG